MDIQQYDCFSEQQGVIDLVFHIDWEIQNQNAYYPAFSGLISDSKTGYALTLEWVLVEDDGSNPEYHTVTLTSTGLKMIKGQRPFPRKERTLAGLLPRGHH